MVRSANRKPPLTTEDYVVLGAFRNALRRFSAFSEAGARTHGLTTQQHQALLAIKAHEGLEPMSISELAETLMIKNHSAVGLVARLQGRGLAERTVSSGDRRRVLLSLTPEAQRMLEDISRANLEQLKSNAETFRSLLASLKRLDLRGGPSDS